MITEWTEYLVLDDGDECVASSFDGDEAYQEAHRLANANDRIYRVRREKHRKVTKVTVIAKPIEQR